MQTTIELMTLILQIGLLVLLFDIARNIRQMNAKTGVSFYVGGDKRFHIGVGKRHGERHIGPCEIAITYSIWVYRGGKWVLLKPCGQDGCDCGPAPAEPGEYEGKVIRKECPRS
jgi:hypothetical protein